MDACAKARPLVLLAFLLAAARASAMIFYGTADASYNTTPPSGSLAGSGWQWVGLWVGFQAVPVGPHHFLAARHIGGSVGDVFHLGSVDYVTTAFQDDTASDLRLWEVSGTFPSWAPLYRANNEVGRAFVVMGRGLTRGTEIRVSGVLKGWNWGAGDQVLRWGENTVRAVTDGGAYWGALLYATFDQAGGPNEAHLAVGDSSGPVFMNDGGGWKLVGVAAAVDGPFNTTSSGDGFPAALFDARGLYYSETPPNNWQLVTGATPVPSGFYITRVSSRVSWIEGIAAPIAGGDVPLFSSPQAWVSATVIMGSGIVLIRRRLGFVRS